MIIDSRRRGASSGVIIPSEMSKTGQREEELKESYYPLTYSLLSKPYDSPLDNKLSFYKLTLSACCTLAVSFNPLPLCM